jgi:hypothetical protein
MALIRVSDTETWKCSAQLFDRLLRQIQETVALSSPELANTIRAARQSHLNWWTMANLSGAGFQSFAHGVQCAEKAWLSKGPESPADLDYYSGVLARLGDLTRVLAADPRTAQPADSALGEHAAH